jgi:hypothetical protein
MVRTNVPHLASETEDVPNHGAAMLIHEAVALDCA